MHSGFCWVGIVDSSMHVSKLELRDAFKIDPGDNYAGIDVKASHGDVSLEPGIKMVPLALVPEKDVEVILTCTPAANGLWRKLREQAAGAIDAQSQDAANAEEEGPFETSAIRFLREACAILGRVVRSADATPEQLDQAQADGRVYMDPETRDVWIVLPWTEETAQDVQRVTTRMAEAISSG